MERDGAEEPKHPAELLLERLELYQHGEPSLMNDRDLDEALYSLSEAGFLEVSRESVLMAHKLVEFLRIHQLPKDCRM